MADCKMGVRFEAAAAQLVGAGRRESNACAA